MRLVPPEVEQLLRRLYGDAKVDLHLAAIARHRARQMNETQSSAGLSPDVLPRPKPGEAVRDAGRLAAPTNGVTR